MIYVCPLTYDRFTIDLSPIAQLDDTQFEQTL